MNEIPMLCPLGPGSKYNDDELRMLLRSVEKNVIGMSKFYLITTHVPKWLKTDETLEIVPYGDPFEHCKDAVLIWKTIETLKRERITGDFVWVADDNCFMQPVDIRTIPPIHNHRENRIFYESNSGRWKERVRHTLEWAKMKGIELEHNFEAHCPERFNATAILRNEEEAEWNDGIGLTITTYFRVITDTYRDSHDQREYKQTFELEMDERPRTMTDEDLHSKAFIGYSDAGVRAGILDRLKRIFTEQSRYER